MQRRHEIVNKTREVIPKKQHISGMNLTQKIPQYNEPANPRVNKKIKRNFVRFLKSYYDLT
jgi:hypothetical protein